MKLILFAIVPVQCNFDYKWYLNETEEIGNGLHQLQDFYGKSFICGNCSFEQIIIQPYRQWLEPTSGIFTISYITSGLCVMPTLPISKGTSRFIFTIAARIWSVKTANFSEPSFTLACQIVLFTVRTYNKRRTTYIIFMRIINFLLEFSIITWWVYVWVCETEWRELFVNAFVRWDF